MYTSTITKMPESLTLPFKNSVCTLEIREQRDSLPFLKVTTSVTLKADKRRQFLKICSSLVSKELANDNQYVQVSIEPGSKTLLSDVSPSAQVELRTLGVVSTTRNQILTQEICQAIEQYLKIPAYKVCVNFIRG